MIWIIDITGDGADFSSHCPERCGGIMELFLCSRSDHNIIALA